MPWSGTSNPASYTVESAAITLVNPTRANYTFKGWTWSGQTTPQTSVTIPQGSTGNKSYTANWTPVDYTITYTLNGGSNASGNPASYTIETATFTLANPTRAGYTFRGWTWSGQTTPQTSVTIAKGSTGNKSYTANWTPVNYTITYTLNGGSNASGNPASYTIETATFTLANPTRSGYTFTGWTWSGQATPRTSVTITRGSTGDKSYTANWNANPNGGFDACEGFANYITLSGWAFDPDEPSQSLSILIQIFRSDGTTLVSEHSLTADLPRDDVNSRYGITGEHGFRATILVAEAGSYTVKVWALDSSDDSIRTQIGGTKTATTTLDANIVQLDYISNNDLRKLATYEAQNGDVLVGSAGLNVNICIADGATVTLYGAHVDRINLQASAIRCRGDATLVLATGTENSVTGNGSSPGVQVGPQGTTLVICGGGTLNASNNDTPLLVLHGPSYRSAAGIGSLDVGELGEGKFGDIVIEGGTINATGGHGSPGIGASLYSTCGSVSISGGVSRVTATAGEDAPDNIGSGFGSSCGSVIIGGVEVGPIAQNPCTYDPKVNFLLGFDGNGAEGSTMGQFFTPNVAQSLNDSTFTPPSNWEFTGWNTSSNGNGTAYAAGQSISLASNMTLFAQWKKTVTVTLATDTGEVTLYNGYVLTGTGGKNTHVTIADGATVTLRGVNITNLRLKNWAGITCEGNATIILEGDNAVTGGDRFPGISVPEGKTLTIQGDGSLAATGNNAAGIGTGDNPVITCGSITIGAGITSLVATGTPCIGGKTKPSTSVTPTIAQGLLSEGSLEGGTFTLRSLTGYERWSMDNSFSGAWNATDALGVPNVFRYAFGKATGAFANAPLLGIRFDGAGKAVVVTPPLVNAKGFVFSIVVSDSVDGTGNVATTPLSASGETTIDETGKTARLFRLRAAEAE